MYRAFPYDTFLGDRSIAECYGRLRPEWKLNSRIWGMTLKRMGGLAGRLPDSGSGFAPGDSKLTQLIKFGYGWAKRRAMPTRNRDECDSIVAEGSWPNFGWCIRNSDRIARTWHEASAGDKAFLNGIFADDLWRRDLTYWSSRPNDFFRLLTVLKWLELPR